jgi:hypothetical protein
VSHLQKKIQINLLFHLIAHFPPNDVNTNHIIKNLNDKGREGIKFPTQTLAKSHNTPEITPNNFNFFK